MGVQPITSGATYVGVASDLATVLATDSGKMLEAKREELQGGR
jgi:hypothetical protein